MVKMTDLSQKEKGDYLFSDITGCCCSTGVVIRPNCAVILGPRDFYLQAIRL
jgi:uncharacterized protein (DUF779 family)